MAMCILAGRYLPDDYLRFCENKGSVIVQNSY